MPSRALLGVDIGTSSAKGAAFGLDGRCLARAEIAYWPEQPREGWAEIDAERWWEATRDILRALVARVGAAVEAVGVTGQAPTLLVVDEDGRPRRPAILWLDVRAAAEVGEVAARAGPDAEHVAGNRLHAYCLGPKLAWLSRHEPEALVGRPALLQSHSLPVLRLTGARVTDFSTAALCAPLYDARARAWSAGACARLGVDARWLPDLRPAHHVAGTVTPAAARETGLAAGTPVVVGGADFAASTLAAGGTAPGEACLMLGTAGNLVMPLARAVFDTRLINSHHVGRDCFLALGATLAGAVQEWFRRAAAPGISFEALDAAAAGVPAGAGGVWLVPSLQGERTPLWDAGARGTFLGLSLSHGRGHLYRAVLEAVAVSFLQCAEVARESGLTLTEVVAVNGGARSAVFRQILSDALGLPLGWAPASPGAPAGAALLAGLGAGVLPGVQRARGWRGELVRHEPHPARERVYADLLAARLRLFPALRRIG